MKLISALVILASAMMACDPIEGTLQVLQPFSANSGEPSKPCSNEEYPCSGNTVEAISVPVGSHGMKIEMDTRDVVQIRLSLPQGEKVLELNMPHGKSIPETGSFSLTSQETQQPFDLNGQTQTTVTNSDEYRGQESCDVPVQEQVCGMRGNPPKYACWMETHYRPGLKDVSYYYKTTHQDMSAQIVQSGRVAAQFQGSRQSTDKIYTYQSPCYIRGY